jgi:hypothetical protein
MNTFKNGVYLDWKEGDVMVKIYIGNRIQHCSNHDQKRRGGYCYDF